MRHSLDLKTMEGRKNFRLGLQWLAESRWISLWLKSYGKYTFKDTLKGYEE